MKFWLFLILVSSGIILLWAVHLEGLFIPFLVVCAGLGIWVLVRTNRKVRCVNCKNVMTLGRWNQNKGCLVCGGDLYEEVK